MKFKHAEKTLNVYGMEFKDDLNALREKSLLNMRRIKKL